ncbi:hypothetical protein [Egbenema bharatensis]|uniref:hypothetical protein n=1 Tax=Egbenema bharatensis TaxID=3463334 RepID=UPI003A883290
MQPEKEVSWKEILGNPYRQTLHPQMLTEEGYTVRKLGRIEGMGKSEQPIPLKIVYRADYVAAFLGTSVFTKLGMTQQDRLLSMFLDAFTTWSQTHA